MFLIPTEVRQIHIFCLHTICLYLDCQLLFHADVALQGKRGPGS